MIGLVVEESGLDLTSLVVNQLNIQQGAFRSRILPYFLSMFLCDASLNFPVKQESVKAFDRSETLVVITKVI